MHLQLPINFNIRGTKLDIIPQLFRIELKKHKKKEYYKREIEKDQYDDNSEELLSFNNNKEDLITIGNVKINLRQYYGNYDLNEYKEIYGIISNVLTKKIKSVSGINQRFSINILLKQLAKEYNEDINDIAPLLPKNTNESHKKKTLKTLNDLIIKYSDDPQQQQQIEPDPVIKGNYCNHIIPISILPILFNKIAIVLGLVRYDNNLYVNQIFDDFNIAYLQSQINDFNIDNGAIDYQIKIMNENNQYFKKLYQVYAFKQLKHIKNVNKELKEKKKNNRKRKREEREEREEEEVEVLSIKRKKLTSEEELL